MTPDNNRIIIHCRNWINDVVIGLNFCPFAKPEMDRERVRFTVSDHAPLEQNLQFFADELLTLDDKPETETSLLIFPYGMEDFDDYLELLELSQEILASIGFEGKFQLASFHPDYCFDGCEPEAAENYTNRSPWPMLHLIREDSVTRAVENYPEAEKIPERNIALARKLGSEAMQKMLDNSRRNSE